MDRESNSKDAVLRAGRYTLDFRLRGNDGEWEAAKAVMNRVSVCQGNDLEKERERVSLESETHGTKPPS
jgi:hypothetical protein